MALLRVCFVAVVVLATGCTTVASARMSQRLAESAAPNQEHALVSSAVLVEGSTIAVMPPSECRDLNAAPTTATSDVLVMRNNCGLVVSELERELASAGFKVVSWQALRPPVTGTAYELARNNKVDAVLEVDQLSLTQLGTGADSELSVEFFSGELGRNATPLVVPDAEATARSCREHLPFKELKTQDQVSSATASVKLVSTSDASVRWLYRRTLAAERSASLTKDFVFVSPASAGGVTLLSLGIASTVAGFVGFGLYSPTMGGSLLAVGLTSMLVGIIWSAIRTPPEDVVCNPSLLRAQGTEVAAAGPRAGSRHLFHEGKLSLTDAGREESYRLLRALSTDVVRSLRASQGLPPRDKPKR